MQTNQYIGLRFVIHIYGGSDVRSNITRPSIYKFTVRSFIASIEYGCCQVTSDLMQAILYKGLQSDLILQISIWMFFSEI